MTINSVNRSAPAVVRSTQSEPVQTPAAAPATPQSTGYAATSSFTPASASSASTSSTGSDTQKAIDILGKTPGGEALKKLLSEPYMLRPEITEAQEEFDKIKDSLSPEDRAVVEQAVAFESCISGSIALGKMIMDRMIEQMKNTKIIPEY
ncbi:MAG: hypothetical protein IAE78_03435 [Myxococcus sp.]|nr:hypothetical protein [Myxococcus sp.]